MDAGERKIKIAELRKHHEATFKALGVPGAYFAAKHAHVPEHMDYKHIGLYESEAGKGDNVYIEFVAMDYTPSDSRRLLYMWEHDSNYKTKYTVKKEQYMIPVSALKVVAVVDSPETKGVEEYTLTKQETEGYTTKHFETPNKQKVAATWKNGVPYQIAIYEADKEGVVVRQEIINHILKIFK